MRGKFFSVCAGLAACSMAGLAGAAEKNLTPIPLSGAMRVSPTAVAKVGPDLRMIGDWMSAPAGPTGCLDTTLFFDCFEPNQDGEPIDGEECVPTFSPTSRWFFGTAFCNPFFANDMTAASNALGAPATRISIAWSWNPPSTRTCYMGIFTAEDFDKSCAGPAFDNTNDGFVLTFENLAPGDGYYYADICLTDFDPSAFLKVPDGKGAYIVLIGEAYDPGTGEITLTCATQPMLWGTGDGEGDDRPGTQNATQWDDDTDVDEFGNCTIDPGTGACANMPDGVLQAPFECYDYAFGLCPDPIGAMFALWGAGEPATCLDLEVSDLVAGSPGVFDVSRGTAGQPVAVFYAFRTGSRQVNAQGWCLDFGIQVPPDPRSNLVCNGTFNGSGTFSCVRPIPGAAEGRTLFFQAGQRGTCPDACMSNVVSELVD